MPLELSKVEKLRERKGFLPILVLNTLLNIVLLACPPSAKAQVSSFTVAEGEISGTVLLAADKRPASQVAVKLKSRVAGVFRSVLTDFEGHFRVRDLPRGTYDIAVDEDGYEAAETSALLDGPSAKLVVYLKARSGPIPQSGYTVSVRELKIPGKAHNEFEQGLQRVAKNDPAGSLSHFTKAIRVFPGYFEAYYNLGVAEMSLGHTGEAMKDFQTSIDLSNGRYALAEFGYAYLLCQQRRPNEAEKMVRRGLEVEDAGPEGYVILGEALQQLDQLDEAEKSVHEALLRNPNYAGAYLVLSDVADRRGDYRLEIQDLDIYLRLQPNGPGSVLARKLRAEAVGMLASSHPSD
jgi:tetratricopeptide (TPR) repeat protein